MHPCMVQVDCMSLYITSHIILVIIIGDEVQAIPTAWLEKVERKLF